jgi:four helix bundle protein
MIRWDATSSVSSFVAEAGIGSNYDAACHAKSRADFAAKVTIVAEEASEAVYWLEVFVAVDLLTDAAARPLIIEGNELAAIATASARTARRRPSEGDRKS